MWLRRIFILLSILSLFITFTGTLSKTVGVSMLPTLEDGDLLIVINSSDYDYGDIVIVRRSYDLVKRIVGKSGDTIQLSDKSYTVRNGNIIEEPYITECDNTTDTVYSVSDGCYFVLGDNRGNSSDSREIGCIEESQIRGKVVCNLTKSFGIRLIHFRVFQTLLIIGILLLSIDWRKKDVSKIEWCSSDRAEEIDKL